MKLLKQIKNFIKWNFCIKDDMKGKSIDDFKIHDNIEFIEEAGSMITKYRDQLLKLCHLGKFNQDIVICLGKLQNETLFDMAAIDNCDEIPKDMNYISAPLNHDYEKSQMFVLTIDIFKIISKYTIKYNALFMVIYELINSLTILLASLMNTCGEIKLNNKEIENYTYTHFMYFMCFILEKEYTKSYKKIYCLTLRKVDELHKKSQQIMGDK